MAQRSGVGTNMGRELGWYRGSGNGGFLTDRGYQNSGLNHMQWT